jgi:RNA polymerase sigma factor (sigma-70 family)
MSDKEINKLWNEYYPKVFGYFYRRLSNRQDIEDLTSISLTSLFTKLVEEDTTISNPHAYLWRICHNQLATYINTKSKKPTLVPYDEGWVPEDDSLETQRSQEFTSRMDSLKRCISQNIAQDDAQILGMSYFEGMDSQEIASKLALSAANVRKKLSRTIQKIRLICNDVWLAYN